MLFIPCINTVLPLAELFAAAVTEVTPAAPGEQPGAPRSAPGTPEAAAGLCPMAQPPLSVLTPALGLCPLLCSLGKCLGTSLKVGQHHAPLAGCLRRVRVLCQCWGPHPAPEPGCSLRFPLAALCWAAPGTGVCAQPQVPLEHPELLNPVFLPQAAAYLSQHYSKQQREHILLVLPAF